MLVATALLMEPPAEPHLLDTSGSDTGLWLAAVSLRVLRGMSHTTVSSQVTQPSEYEPPLHVTLPPQAKVNRMPGARAVLLATRQWLLGHANAAGAHTGPSITYMSGSM